MNSWKFCSMRPAPLKCRLPSDGPADYTVKYCKEPGKSLLIEVGGPHSPAGPRALMEEHSEETYRKGILERGELIPDCEQCKNRLACLIDPWASGTFEAIE